MKDKSILWMAAFGVALFLFFACPPVRRRTVRAQVGGIRTESVTHSGGAVVIAQHAAQALPPMDDPCFSKMSRFGG